MTLTIPGGSVRGLVAHDDGTVALLVVRGTSMVLTKLRADGTAVFATPVVNDPPAEVEGKRWVDSWATKDGSRSPASTTSRASATRNTSEPSANTKAIC